MMSTTGAFSTKNTPMNVILMAIAGLAGFVFVKCKLNSPAMILGLVLGLICEANLRRAYIMISGDTFFQSTVNLLKRPVTGIVIPVCVVVLLSPVVKPLSTKKKAWVFIGESEMDIKQTGIAGTMESSDVMVTIQPGSKGIEIEIESIVDKQFGREIRRAITETLRDMDVKNARIKAVDKGALDCTIRARVKTAVCRSNGKAPYEWKVS